MIGVDHHYAVSVLKDAGNDVTMVISRDPVVTYRSNKDPVRQDFQGLDAKVSFRYFFT